MPLWAAITCWFWGLLMWLFFWSAFKWRLKGSRWPTVPGKILDREQHFLYHSKAGRVGDPGRDVYAGSVKYTYAVHGVTYTGDTLYANEKTRGDKYELEYIFKKLPEEPPVHYKPENPAQSFLLYPRLDKIIVAWAEKFSQGSCVIGALAIIPSCEKVVQVSRRISPSRSTQSSWQFVDLDLVAGNAVLTGR